VSCMVRLLGGGTGSVGTTEPMVHQRVDTRGQWHSGTAFVLSARALHCPMQTAAMGQRFTVQADTERDCADGLHLLLSLGLELAMPPRLLSDNRWMARAIPGTTRAPAGDVRGHSAAG
jgi:hypothetical protein